MILCGSAVGRMWIGNDDEFSSQTSSFYSGARLGTGHCADRSFKTLQAEQNIGTVTRRLGRKKLAKVLATWRELETERLQLASGTPLDLVTAYRACSTVALTREDAANTLLSTIAQMPVAFVDQRLVMVKALREELRAEIDRIDLEQIEPVLRAMADVPRERFVHKHILEFAYLPTAMSIGHEQTISHPLMVARMTVAAALTPHARVLDIGTGSAYQAAILACVAETVISIEIVEPLATAARARLQNLGYGNVDVRLGDGFEGAPDRAPFDAIIIAAAACAVPAPLLEQLRVGGRLIMPIGPTRQKAELMVATKLMSGDIQYRSLGPALFVPLIGKGQADGEIA